MWVSVPGACFCSFSHPTALSCGLVMGLPKQTLLQKCRVVWDVSKLPFSAAVFSLCPFTKFRPDWIWMVTAMAAELNLSFSYQHWTGLKSGRFAQAHLVGDVWFVLGVVFCFLWGCSESAHSGDWAGHLYSAACTESLWRTTADLACVQYKESKF